MPHIDKEVLHHNILCSKWSSDGLGIQWARGSYATSSLLLGLCPCLATFHCRFVAHRVQNNYAIFFGLSSKMMVSMLLRGPDCACSP